MWNEIIKIKNATKDAQVKINAELLLNQLNTAGGPSILRKEAELFINKNGGGK